MKEKINKLSVFFNIVLLIISAIQMFDSRILEFVFQGHLNENVITSQYPQRYRGEYMYLTVLNYSHSAGRYSIQDISITARVEDNGADLVDYAIDYKDTIPKTAVVEKILDRRFFRIEINKLRPNDTFDILLYTRQPAKIATTVRQASGSFGGEQSPVRWPALWIIALLTLTFATNAILCRRILNRETAEKNRVIEERNKLQDLLLEGQRKSTRRKEDGGSQRS